MTMACKFIAGFTLIFVWCEYVHALTVQRISFVELSKAADVIIQAIVEPGGARVEVRNETPWTCLTLRVQRVIKGSSADRRELCFMGGTVGQITSAIPGQIIPEEGKEGFFFLRASSGNYVNPIVGWSQGLFYVTRDGGQATVTSAQGNRIEDITLAPTALVDAIDTSVPQGVMTGRSSTSGPVTTDSFIAAIQQAMSAP